MTLQTVPEIAILCHVTLYGERVSSLKVAPEMLSESHYISGFQQVVGCTG